MDMSEYLLQTICYKACKFWDPEKSRSKPRETIHIKAIPSSLIGYIKCTMVYCLTQFQCPHLIHVISNIIICSSKVEVVPNRSLFHPQ